MDETDFGSRDRRGHWKPFQKIAYAPLFVWPFKPAAFLKWVIRGYIFSWNLLYAALAVMVWMFFTPPIESMSTLSVEWVAFIFFRNAALMIIWFGGFHVRLYVKRSQGNQFKYNPRWQSGKSDFHLFGSQTYDNLFWCFCSGLPIWTAYEVATFWMMANGYIPYLDFETNPFAFVSLMLLIPLFREFHFYCIHRLIHWPPLYRTVHKVHHANVNPGPWSGLSMHPVEHLLYFSSIFVHWIVPSHPIHALNQLIHAGLSPGPDHTGFDKIVYSETGSLETHCFAHYLHHKHFQVNYSDGIIPLDKWFGTFHDGTDKAEKAMNERHRNRAARRTEKRA
ncbi:MAG: sterol desaturase family protein [Albidovulum sp.]|nr:sterol desaturase family protein [Albidovulum sp.]